MAASGPPLLRWRRWKMDIYQISGRLGVVCRLLSTIIRRRGPDARTRIFIIWKPTTWARTGEPRAATLFEHHRRKFTMTRSRVRLRGRRQARLFERHRIRSEGPADRSLFDDWRYRAGPEVGRARMVHRHGGRCGMVAFRRPVYLERSQLRLWVISVRQMSGGFG